MKRTSIVRNMTVGSIAIIFATFCIALGANYWLAVVQWERSYEELMARQLEQLAQSLKNPLWSFDEETTRLIGDAYMTSDDVVSLSIFLQTDAEAVYKSEKETSAGVIYGRKEVFYQGELIGHLEVGLSRSSFSESIFRLLEYTLFAASFMVVCLYFFMKVLFSKYLAKPLIALEEWTDQVARGDYDSDPRKIHEVELTAVVQKFADMSDTVRKREAALQESQQKFRDLTELLPQVIFETDADLNISYTNPAGIRLSKYSQADFDQGINLGDLMVADDRKRAANSAQTVMAGRTVDGSNEYTILCKDGTLLPVLIYASPILQDGRATGLRGVLVDISKDKELENKLQQAQKMEAIGNLAGGIAHDFNNILAASLGFTELALDDAEPGSHLESLLREVQAAGERAKELVKQILAFARQSEEAFKPIQVSAVIEETLKFIRSSIPTTIEIKKQIQSKALIMGNFTQFHQVLMNLCTNAAHAMEDDGGILEVSLEDLQVDQPPPAHPQGLKPGSYLKLTVSDTGTGIPSEIIDAIFEPYFTTKGPGEGTGMGLAVAHGIIESYGGKIVVESTPGRGTTFTIYLPSTSAAKAGGPYRPRQLPTGTERILFVDDEAPIAKINSRILENLGYAVKTRTSSLEALELFRSAPGQFDLVITDMTMPNMTGDKLALELIRIRPDIPVILCTGYSKKMTEDQAAEIGIRAFAYKPVLKADLANVVRKVLDETAVAARD